MPGAASQRASRAAWSSPRRLGLLCSVPKAKLMKLALPSVPRSKALLDITTAIKRVATPERIILVSLVGVAWVCAVQQWSPGA